MSNKLNETFQRHTLLLKKMLYEQGKLPVEIMQNIGPVPHDYENAHREKVAKEKEDSIKYIRRARERRATRQRQRKKFQIVNIVVWGAVLLKLLAVVLENDSSKNDSSENNNLESGKEVKVKTPISRIEKNANTPVEKTFLDKVKSKIPPYFTVKYNPNLGKEVDLDFKKVMVTVSDLNLAKSLVNAKTDLNEDSTSTDVSLKDLIKIVKTQGADGLKKAAEKIVSA